MILLETSNAVVGMAKPMFDLSAETTEKKSKGVSLEWTVCSAVPVTPVCTAYKVTTTPTLGSTSTMAWPMWMCSCSIEKWVETWVVVVD